MSCADVCLSMDYDEYNTFYNEKNVRARKAHTCCECREVIGVGELHQVSTGKHSDGFFSERTCAPCVEIRTAFVCGTFVFGELWEHIRADMFPVWKRKGEWDCLAKLATKEAIDKCMAEYRKWLNDDDQGEGRDGN